MFVKARSCPAEDYLKNVAKYFKTEKQNVYSADSRQQLTVDWCPVDTEAELCQG